MSHTGLELGCLREQIIKITTENKRPHIGLSRSAIISCSQRDCFRNVRWKPDLGCLLELMGRQALSSTGFNPPKI